MKNVWAKASSTTLEYKSRVSHAGSYLCFVRNTLASLNSVCSLCAFMSPTNRKLFFVNTALTDIVSIVTAVTARLSTSWWDELSWCDSRVIVSDLSNRSLIFVEVLPSAMLTWGWQGLGFNPEAGGANEPNLQSDKRRDSQQTPRWCCLLFYPTYRLNM